MATTAGSFALLNSIPSSDATVITKLRLAGAIILGKTTMTELGSLKSSVQKMGQSARGGQGQSAYVAGGDPRGTSSGSAIAVSAG
jgi:amidase